MSAAIRWRVEPRDCSHSLPQVCPTCDHDEHYALTYEDCPWRDPCPHCGAHDCDRQWCY